MCVCVCECVCECVCVCVCVCCFIKTSAQTHTDTHTHAHTQHACAHTAHTRTHTHTHTHTYTHRVFLSLSLSSPIHIIYTRTLYRKTTATTFGWCERMFSVFQPGISFIPSALVHAFLLLFSSRSFAFVYLYFALYTVSNGTFPIRNWVAFFKGQLRLSIMIMISLIISSKAFQAFIPCHGPCNVRIPVARGLWFFVSFQGL